MKTSTFARMVVLLMGATPVTTLLAHPGHQHNSGAMERLLHALETGWGPVLLLTAIGISGIAFLKRRRNKKTAR